MSHSLTTQGLSSFLPHQSVLCFKFRSIDHALNHCFAFWSPQQSAVTWKRLEEKMFKIYFELLSVVWDSVKCHCSTPTTSPHTWDTTTRRYHNQATDTQNKHKTGYCKNATRHMTDTHNSLSCTQTTRKIIKKMLINELININNNNFTLIVEKNEWWL